MSRPGSPELPLRVAVIGAGPAGFFVAQYLTQQTEVAVAVDLYERLPMPFGLVRYGVAPDHEEIKRVARSFDKTAAKPNVRLFANVEFGSHVTLDDLRRHYHQVCFATGAQTDRRLGIPGEDLAGSHAATEFVAWYNGHPDYRHCTFDLSCDRVAVIGVGNVAVDVARILLRSPAELATTDIADHALAALRSSRVREVVMLGRRGPVQAAFTNAELKELGELAGVDVIVRPDEVELDPASKAELERVDDRTLERRIEILREFAAREPRGQPRRLVLRFLMSPLELRAGPNGHVAAMRIGRNVLLPDERGALQARPTGATEDLPVGLVFRSVGYRGIPLPGVPFDERSGTVPNLSGRVLDPASGRPIPGLYVSGWLKRGPSGVIGTNKPDAAETVKLMLGDAAQSATIQPDAPDSEAVERLIRRRQPAVVTYSDWRLIDDLETRRGKSAGRPRVKFTSAEDALAALRARG
ncbi:MAG TPA: FAD-dependent oxidoreductase [Gemmatimonadales bacterium]|nr:FAD-dependent oxidoreductase [Gemmatimonadales bacterium]